jgi:hypothetical protein
LASISQDFMDKWVLLMDNSWLRMRDVQSECGHELPLNGVLAGKPFRSLGSLTVVWTMTFSRTNDRSTNFLDDVQAQKWISCRSRSSFARFPFRYRAFNPYWKWNNSMG